MFLTTISEDDFVFPSGRREKIIAPRQPITRIVGTCCQPISGRDLYFAGVLYGRWNTDFIHYARTWRNRKLLLLQELLLEDGARTRSLLASNDVWLRRRRQRRVAPAVSRKGAC